MIITAIRTFLKLNYEEKEVCRIKNEVKRNSKAASKSINKLNGLLEHTDVYTDIAKVVEGVKNGRN